jgi:hypothetical protein
VTATVGFCVGRSMGLAIATKKQSAAAVHPTCFGSFCGSILGASTLIDGSYWRAVQSCLQFGTKHVVVFYYR